MGYGHCHDGRRLGQCGGHGGHYSAASGAAISTINNGGDLGDVLKEITSSDALKGYITAGHHRWVLLQACWIKPLV